METIIYSSDIDSRIESLFLLIFIGIIGILIIWCIPKSSPTKKRRIPPPKLRVLPTTKRVNSSCLTSTTSTSSYNKSSNEGIKVDTKREDGINTMKTIETPKTKKNVHDNSKTSPIQSSSSQHTPLSNSKKKHTKKEKKKRSPKGIKNRTSSNQSLYTSYLSEHELYLIHKEKDLANQKFEEMCKAEEELMKKQAQAIRELNIKSPYPNKYNGSIQQDLASRSIRSNSEPMKPNLIHINQNELNEENEKKSMENVNTINKISIESTRIINVKNDSSSSSEKASSDSQVQVSNHTDRSLNVKESNDSIIHEVEVTFCVICPQLPSIYYNGFAPIHLATCKNGDWDQILALPLLPSMDDPIVWKIVLSLSTLITKFAYRIVAWDVIYGRWEYGPIQIGTLNSSKNQMIIEDIFWFSTIKLSCSSLIQEKKDENYPEYNLSYISKDEMPIKWKDFSTTPSISSCTSTNTSITSLDCFPMDQQSISSPSHSSPWSSTLLLNSYEDTNLLFKTEDEICNFADAENLVSSLLT